MRGPDKRVFVEEIGKSSFVSSTSEYLISPVTLEVTCPSLITFSDRPNRFLD